jgi:hypothetical protein
VTIQVRGLAIAVPIAVAATAESPAAPINGTSIKVAVPAATTDVRYRVRRGYRTDSSYRGYPTYDYSYPGDAKAWPCAAPSSCR